MQQQDSVWQGRDDSTEQGDTRRIYQLIRHDSGYAAGDAVLLGFASDAGVLRNKGRVGAAAGPDHIRRALAGLPAHGLQALWDAGDVECHGDLLEEAQNALADKVSGILDGGARLVVFGGGHEIAWGDYQGLRDHLYGPAGAGGSLLVLNLDAHLDMRTSRPASSGTPFDQILADSRERSLPVRYACYGVSRLGNTAGLYAHAESMGVHIVEDCALQERHLDDALASIDLLLAAADHVYLTVDIDVLPAATAPGVSAPSAFGVPICVIEAIALHVKNSGKLRLADLAELNPSHDIDGRTARVAARLAWQLLQP